MIGLRRKLSVQWKAKQLALIDQNIEIYSETLDLYHTLVPLNQELHKLRLKTQKLNQ
ncbi:Sensor histidine kinase VraS [Staphylococcus aureus]|uniref:Sensor histidine kinase VraS n=1 Tax=Staphylococcus aureus TaxID=1280 RepID=A0A380EKS1_STAAU|nr:Sensor histidine kinase VraS [Staphylococcus aureus]